MALHQVLVAAAPGDAITNEAVRLRDLLRQQGPSEIYAHHLDPRVPGVRRLADYAEAEPQRRDNVLVYHASIGEPEVAEFLLRGPEKLVLRYHNITPAPMFRPFDPRLARLLEAGRDELASLKGRAEGCVAVSRYNARDLEELGFGTVRVAPLLMDISGLLAAHSEPALPSRFLVRQGEPLVSFVGRLAPNKGHAELIQAFHVLKTYLRTDAHMFLVGADDLESYRETLASLIQQLALRDIQITGAVPFGHLADIYRRTDVMLCMSAHEGFCAPLVEAMAFGIPVVALGSSAIPETVGDAAILLDEPNPLLAAEAVNLVLADRALREAMVERGRSRAGLFAPGVVGPRLVQAILDTAA